MNKISQQIDCEVEQKVVAFHRAIHTSHAQPSSSYSNLLQLAAHPFNPMSDPAASHTQTHTFVYINNY